MLKEERIKKGYTQEKLAELTNIDPRTILRIEKNLTIPKIDTYAKLVIALELTNEEIGENIRKISIIKGDKSEKNIHNIDSNTNNYNSDKFKK